MKKTLGDGSSDSTRTPRRPISEGGRAGGAENGRYVLNRAFVPPIRREPFPMRISLAQDGRMTALPVVCVSKSL